MKDYKQYNHEEIKEIADKIQAGEFVYPTSKEMKLWYEYKRAVKHEIYECEQYLKVANDMNGATENEELNIELSDIAKRVQEDLNTAKQELAWIRSIHTYDLEGFCKYWIIASDETDAHLQPNLIHMIARRIVEGDASESDKQFARELFEESNYRERVLEFTKMTLPVALRRWGHAFRRPNEYCPFDNVPDDAGYLYDRREHYVYVESECKAKWGDSYWVSVDCDNVLYSLPVIKAFKEFDFEVGKFYKIQCVDEIHWGNNKKKYIMDIEEVDEETFLEKGLRQYATRW